MMKVKVENRSVKVLRQWEKDAILVVVLGLLGGLWITGYLGAWIG